jgi:hypothetical protein
MKKKKAASLIEAYHSGGFRKKRLTLWSKVKKVFDSILGGFSRTRPERTQAVERKARVEPVEQKAPAKPVERKAPVKPTYGAGKVTRLKALEAGESRASAGAFSAIGRFAKKNVVASSVLIGIILMFMILGVGYVIQEREAPGVVAPVEKDSEGRVREERASFGGNMEKLELEEVEPRPPADVGGGEAAEPPEGPLYRLRIVTYASRQESMVPKVLDFLKDNGIEATARRTNNGKWIVVYVNQVFADDDSADSRALLRKIQNLEYLGRKDFASARFFEIP